MKARAVRFREPGDPSVLEVAEIEVREPGPGEVAIEVAAAGLNRADLLQRRGLYPPPPGLPPDVLGLEYAGTVTAIGANVRDRQVGDRVMGIVGGGGMATRVITHERETIPVPERLSLTEAAAIPEVFLTAFDLLFEQAGLRMGETVLVHSVGSGVGTALAQLAHASSATTIGTSRTADKIERARAFGLTHGIVVSGASFAERVQDLTRGAGADVIADAVGGDYLAEDLRALAPRGRIVVYGAMAGASADLPLALLMSRRARLTGTVLRARPIEEKISLARRFAREALPLFTTGALRPVIADVLTAARAREAHERLERNDTFGKIVLTWN